MIVVAGEALIDRMVTVDGAAVDASGGAPFNVARALGRLGADVAFVGAVSTDDLGDRLLGELERDGVVVTGVQRTSRPTTLAVATVDASGAATYEFVVDGTSAPTLSPVELPADVSAFVTGGLALVLDPMRASILSAVGVLPADVVVFVDVNCRPSLIRDRAGYLDGLREIFVRADIVKVSDDDLVCLAPDFGVADIIGMGVGAVLVTAGERGTTIVTATGERHQAAAPAPGPVVDTIGAGDTFVAAVVEWIVSAGLDRTDLARLVGLVDGPGRLAPGVRAGGVAAAWVVTRHGCDPPTTADLRSAT